MMYNTHMAWAFQLDKWITRGTFEFSTRFFWH